MPKVASAYGEERRRMVGLSWCVWCRMPIGDEVQVAMARRYETGYGPRYAHGLCHDLEVERLRGEGGGE